jgi:hypothetical protein
MSDLTKSALASPALDLAAIRQRADRMERDHECPLDPKRAGWCAKEPCGTMQTVMQLRRMADQIERLRERFAIIYGPHENLPGESHIWAASCKACQADDAARREFRRA